MGARPCLMQPMLQRRLEYQRPHVTWRKNPKAKKSVSYLGSSHVIRKQRRPRDSSWTTLTTKASQICPHVARFVPLSGGGRGEEGSNQSTPGSADVRKWSARFRVTGSGQLQVEERLQRRSTVTEGRSPQAAVPQMNYAKRTNRGAAPQAT